MPTTSRHWATGRPQLLTTNSSPLRGLQPRLSLQSLATLLGTHSLLPTAWVVRPCHLELDNSELPLILPLDYEHEDGTDLPRPPILWQFWQSFLFTALQFTLRWSKKHVINGYLTISWTKLRFRIAPGPHKSYTFTSKWFPRSAIEFWDKRPYFLKEAVKIYQFTSRLTKASLYNMLKRFSRCVPSPGIDVWRQKNSWGVNIGLDSLFQKPQQFQSVQTGIQLKMMCLGQGWKLSNSKPGRRVSALHFFVK